MVLISKVNNVQWAILPRIAPRSNVSATTVASQDTSPQLVPRPEPSQLSNAILAAA